MIIVLQCAASKDPEGGCMRRRDGRKLKFVADPASAPPDAEHDYARPDDVADTGRSWREELWNYNAFPRDNPLGLLPAWRLYSNPAYGRLAERFGTDNFYILSAGWGLLRSDFLTPQYDITFSTVAPKHKRRRPRDRYADFRMLPLETEAPIVFFVSKEYVRLACQLTDGVKALRTLFYNSATPPEAPGVKLLRYATRTRTNWHYECVNAFLRGEVEL